MTKYSNGLVVNVTSGGGGGGGGGGGNQPNLEITDYNVSAFCTPYKDVNGNPVYQISASGTVLYNGNPLPNVTVKMYFCSDYDPTTHKFSTWIEVKTDQNGKFSSADFLVTTPPGGQVCIASLVYYNDMYADKEMSATIPSC